MSRSRTADLAPVAGTHIAVRVKLFHRAKFVLERANFVWALVRNVPAVLIVLTTGVSALHVQRDGGGRALAAAELLASAWVLILVGREAWRLFNRDAAKVLAHPNPDDAPREAPRIDMANLAAAALAYVQAWQHARAVGRFEPLDPYIVVGTVSLLMALGGRRALVRHEIRPRFFIIVTPAGIEYKAGPRTSWRAKWAEVAAVDHAPHELIVRLQSGRSRALRAAAFYDGEAVLVETSAALAAYAPPHVTGAIGGATSRESVRVQ